MQNHKELLQHLLDGKSLEMDCTKLYLDENGLLQAEIKGVDIKYLPTSTKPIDFLRDLLFLYFQVGMREKETN